MIRRYNAKKGKKGGRKKPRSAAQKAATQTMILAAKKARSATGAPKAKGKKRRTAAQKRAARANLLKAWAARGRSKGNVKGQSITRSYAKKPGSKRLQRVAVTTRYANKKRSKSTKRRYRNDSSVLASTVASRSPNRGKRRRNQAGLFAEIKRSLFSVPDLVKGSALRGLGSGVGLTITRNAQRVMPGIFGGPVGNLVLNALVPGLIGGLSRFLPDKLPLIGRIDKADLVRGAADVLRDNVALAVAQFIPATVPALMLMSPAVAVAASLPAPEGEEGVGTTEGSLVDSTAGTIEMTNGVVSMHGSGRDMAMAGLTAYGGEYYDGA